MIMFAILFCSGSHVNFYFRPSSQSGGPAYLVEFAFHAFGCLALARRGALRGLSCEPNQLCPPRNRSMNAKKVRSF
jgi:hypothetical protein